MGRSSPSRFIQPGFFSANYKFTWKRSFCNFAFLCERKTIFGCYIVFSGFSASRANLAQDKFFEHNLCDREHCGASKTQDEWPAV
jgi:hypothetical protein